MKRREKKQRKCGKKEVGEEEGDVKKKAKGELGEEKTDWKGKS